MSVTKFCQDVHSIQEASMRLHEQITVGNGFSMYQCDMHLSHVMERCPKLGTRGVVVRGPTAGPGMVPIALHLGFSLDLAAVLVDKTEVAAERDDAHTRSDAPAIKRSKKSMFKCKADHYRQAAGVCAALTELLSECELMQHIMAYYSLSCFSFDLVEYFLCELRRLIHAPQKRRAHGKAPEQARAWVDKHRREWLSAHVRV